MGFTHERRESLAAEGVDGVATESTREIGSEQAIAATLVCRHGKFVADIELRDAAQGQQERECLTIAGRDGCLHRHSGETVRVVVAEEGQQMGRVGINRILRNVLVDSCQSLVPIVGFLVEGTVQQSHEREVHDGGKFGIVVLSCQFGTFLPLTDAHVVVEPSFSDDVEVRIFSQQGLVPARHGLAVGIRIGVLTDAVNAGILCPPDAVLSEIFPNVRIALIQVGHDLHEPSVPGIRFVCFAAVDVGDG